MKVDKALTHLDAGKDEGRQRSTRMPFLDAMYGISLGYMAGEFWQQELIRSAAQMEQSRCSRWVLIQLSAHFPYEVSTIEVIMPGRFSDLELLPGFKYIDNLVRDQARFTGRNDSCPCGSGVKYKKCHLGQV